MKTSNLRGRTVVVTGAGSGIGRATALLAARRGADLAICDVDDAGLAETEAAARTIGSDVLTRHVDVADPDQMRDFSERVDAVDLLINNAGVAVQGGLLDTELEDWRWIVSINLMGVVNGCHFFVPKMVERGGGGHVANLSSMAGYHASPALVAYSATKFAALGLSEALREELRAHGIGVTAICPGIINTPITRNVRVRGAGADPESRARVQALYARRNYSADRVARKIMSAVERDRTVAPVAPEAWVSYALKRVSPRLAGWAARRLATVGD